jgi:hypothetical protein
MRKGTRHILWVNILPDGVATYFDCRGIDLKSA